MRPWLADNDYSPMILTNTRLRRRPSRLTGQPFRLASKDPLPGTKVQPAVGNRHHHGFAWRPMTRNSCELRSASGGRQRCSLVPLGMNLAGAVVPPASGSAMAGRREGGQPLQPFFVIGVQAPLVVIDKHRCGNVHCVHKDQCPLCGIPHSYH